MKHIGAKMINTEVVKFKLLARSEEFQKKLMEDIRIRMKGIKDAQSESGDEEDRYFPLVRVG